MRTDQPATAKALPADPQDPREERLRSLVSRAFSWFEDAVYVGLALMLAYAAAALLLTGGVALWHTVLQGSPMRGIIELLDRSLLVLMVVEILYTVRVSFRSHVLTAEPFLVVGLIAVTRRILVVTAEFSQLVEKGEAPFNKAMIEVGLLTGMVLALGISLYLLRERRGDEGEGARRAELSDKR